MSIKKIDKVYCSLNLGYIYNLNYSFIPREGCKITLFFVNESGEYKTDILSASKKAQIKIGGAIFNMLPIRAREVKNGTEKTLSVDFIDDTFKLRNYYVSLTNKGCGKNVFQLGRTVDNRTDAQKQREDGDLFRIKEFTTFDDLEYSFFDFVQVLKRVFPVKTLAQIDSTVTRPFEGTFAEVLDSWCAYFNLSYFFENGELLIFDPVSMNVAFPTIPEDAVSSSYEESIESMYDKTVWNAFTDNGGEVLLKSSSGDNIFLTNETLFPWENVFDIKTLNVSNNGEIDKLQLAAAQYGKEFWFLYNYRNGTADTECGFREVSVSRDHIKRTSADIADSLTSTTKIAFFDEVAFEENYQKYFNYGREIAGRYYISNSNAGLENFSLYSWFDVNQINPVTTDALRKLPSVRAELYRNPADKSFGAISETISGSYKGLILNGQRIYVKDNDIRNFEATFALNENTKKNITGLFNQIINGNFGSRAMMLADGIERDYLIYESRVQYTSDISSLFSSLIGKTSIFDYRYKSNFRIRGYFNVDNLSQDPNLPFDDTNIQIINSGPNIISNTSVIKAKKNSSLVAYYSKYSSCVNESSDSGLLNRRFESISPSIDVSTPVSVTKNSNGVITINRNLNYLQLYQNSSILRSIAKPFAIPEKKLTFTLNYFNQNVPTSFLSNGLVGLSVDVGSEGLTASYSYSNEMLRVPESQQFIEKLEKSIKNSYIRNYVPVIQKDI